MEIKEAIEKLKNFDEKEELIIECNNYYYIPKGIRKIKTKGISIF